tara:strand:+ start:2348 stop:2689 length:342 start_codon:yes stop_codon:yes gene_type:complete
MRRQLGQLRPANTTAASVFTPAVSGEYKITSILIANVSGSAALAGIYHDKDGSTYDETTAIVFNKRIAHEEYVHLIFEDGIGDYLAAGNLGVKTSVGNALTFTVYGEIVGEEL